jgi:hypothetical protein
MRNLESEIKDLSKKDTPSLKSDTRTNKKPPRMTHPDSEIRNPQKLDTPTWRQTTEKNPNFIKNICFEFYATSLHTNFALLTYCSKRARKNFKRKIYTNFDPIKF